MICFLLNINFQFGDFAGTEQSSIVSALWDCLPAAIGSGLAIWGSLWIFKKQINEETAQKNIEKKEEDNQNCLYLAYSINQIIKITKAQADFIGEFTKEARNSPQDQFSYLKLNTKNEIVRFVNKPDLNKLYHSYLSIFGAEKDTIKTFSNIVNIIDTIEELFKLFIDAHVKAQEFDFERRKKFSNLYEEIKTELIIICEDTSDSEVVERIKKEAFIPLIVKDAKDVEILENRKSLAFFKEMFIDPVKLNIINYKLYNFDKRFLKVADKLRSATIIYRIVIEQNIHHFDLLDKEKKLMEDLHLKLNKISEPIRNLIN